MRPSDDHRRLDTPARADVPRQRGSDPAGVDDETRPTWMGGPGYTPVPEGMAPHAPLPGAPPYPAAEEPADEPAPGRTGPLRALLATLVWVLVEVAARSVGTPPSPRDLLRLSPGIALAVVITTVAVWVAARPRRRAVWLLVVVAGPVYYVLRMVGAAAGL